MCGQIPIEKHYRSFLRGDAGQNAPPSGNLHHTTYKTPQKVVSAFGPLVLHSFPPFQVKPERWHVMKVFVFIIG